MTSKEKIEELDYLDKSIQYDMLDKDCLEIWKKVKYDLKILEEIRNCVFTFDEYSGVPAALVLKKIREILNNG